VIRVNLLPHAAERRAAPETSQTWMLVVMGVVVVEIVALFFFHQTKTNELEQLNSEVQAVQTQIEDIQKLVKDHERIKKDLEVLRAREDAIARLQQDRRGPTGVLLELAKVLTSGKSPTIDQDKVDKRGLSNPADAYNPNWDARRVWLVKYEEKERAVELQGKARDGSDVSEVANRLKLSVHFDDVQLLPGEQESQSEKSVDLVKFALRFKVRY
jgi:type IV pilus assembly protein PilN